MTVEEIREMAKTIPRTHSELIGKIVEVMMQLRNMDVEYIDAMINVHKIALPYMPEELKTAFIGMITDMVLIKAFIEQAKAYDKTEEGNKAFEAVFGKIEGR